MTSFGEIVENTTYIVDTPLCYVCGFHGQVEVPMKGFLIRQLGALIQDAYPDMDLGLREQMISGTHPDCWKKVYGLPHGENGFAKESKDNA